MGSLNGSVAELEKHTWTFLKSGHITWERCVEKSALITSTFSSELLGPKCFENSLKFRKRTWHIPHTLGNTPSEVWAAPCNQVLIFLCQKYCMSKEYKQSHIRSGFAVPRPSKLLQT